MKRYLFVLLLMFVLFSSAAFCAGKVFASVDSFPKPGGIPCPNEKDPEYSSDRPYQASPCGDRPVTTFCKNKIVVDLGSVSTPYCDRLRGEATNCPVEPPLHRDQTIVIDLTNVQLPILGNTQLTVNNQNINDQIDDGTKINNFVAWYLNGTNDKTEYPPTDITTPEGVSKTVDYSGPLKKLLPSVIQDAQRLISISSADHTIDYSKPQDLDLSKKITTNDPENHNQIAVCANDIFQILPEWITKLLGLPTVGVEKPIPCYPSSNSNAQGDLILRLKDWNGQSNLQNAINLTMNSLKILFPGNVLTDILANVGVRWPKNYPPLPWADENGNPFTANTYYQKAYNEWRGELCGILPIGNPGTLVCVNPRPIITNPYADLYPYVPLANTVDKNLPQTIEKGDVNVEASNVPPEDLIIDPPQVAMSPEFYFAHSLENYSLSNTLKTTYVPSSVTTKNTKGYQPDKTVPDDVEINGPDKDCKIIDSRINPGDDVTFTKPKSFLDVTVHYTIKSIDCSTPNLVCPKDPLTGKEILNSPLCRYHANCTSNVSVTLPMTSRTPYADEIWKNTVAGSDSIFRRIYPKTGPDAPLNCIANTPAVSPVKYRLRDAPDSFTVENDNNIGLGGIGLNHVVEQDNKTIMTGSSMQIESQVFFPHYGGVLDYFLKGIQTALRPQGFAEPQPANGTTCTTALACGELPTLPKGAGSCNLGGTSSNVGSIPQSLKDIVSAAAQTYKVPPNLILGIMFGEGAFKSEKGNSTGHGYDWTEANVKDWASCKLLPNCSSGLTSVVPFTNWSAAAGKITPDIRKLDPNAQISPCNLLDAIYALAWELHDNAGGGGKAGQKCYGITLISSIPNSCDSSVWSDGVYESAINVWELGAGSACYSKVGSCSGGTSVAPCPLGQTTDPSCEVVGGSGNTSHNACVWIVGHGQNY